MGLFAREQCDLMSDPQFEKFRSSSFLNDVNASFIEALYETYLTQPAAIPENWRHLFEQFDAEVGRNGGAVSHAHVREKFKALAKLNGQNKALSGELFDRVTNQEKQQLAVLSLINSYRQRGHQQADIEPLHLTDRVQVPDLQLEYHGLSETDLDKVFHGGSLHGGKKATLREIYQIVRQTYCGPVGIEYRHITDTEQRRWIQSRIEEFAGTPNYTPERRRLIWQQVMAAEGLEHYLHTRYVGQKRFSLEGGESLIPMMHNLIQSAGSVGVKEIVVGMAHRGRLNVLVNVVGKKPEGLFSEFDDKHTHTGAGDVKYHMGFSSDINTPGGLVHVALAFNPSHLEIINPVVEGSVRARQERRQDSKRNQVIPILLHGDAAFAGQGVVMETLNLAHTRGFSTGGTIHIVVNNQIGFTTSDPLDTRSTLYCTDVAKMVQAPIIHVNGDRPEAVVWASQMALDYRMRFGRDVVIDMVCYRRHGHNEADEPSMTQPVMYQHIRAIETTAQKYSNQLIDEQVIQSEDVEQEVKSYQAKLDEGICVAPNVLDGFVSPKMIDWTPYLDATWDTVVETAISEQRLSRLAASLSHIPEDLNLHPRIVKLLKTREEMGKGNQPMDWGYAETLAYASLLEDGYPVRLSGQDCGRGTFSHRHSVLHDQTTGERYLPLQHIEGVDAHFLVIDSLLSEEAVLGFEFGYSSTDPQSLVIWEAQFGDFANGAQVVIDQFISSSESKWERLSALTLFLPHGFEGQGPEHSSARLERFLQLCAENNMHVVVPSTPAQLFHMLRRQMIRKLRNPLIVMMPKSLLRHKASTSTLEDLTSGGFQLVIPEEKDLEREQVQKVILCSGKIYYELVAAREERNLDKEVAIVRVEQLYPVPAEALAEVVHQYSNAETLVWCQEEPKNMGAWHRLRHHFERAALPNQRVAYAGRMASASPAVGSYRKHMEQQRAVIDMAFLV